MSVRAYRVIKIKTAGESFNLWHDTIITDWLANNTDFFSNLNLVDCNGLTAVTVEELELMLKDIGDQIDPDTRKAIEKDIKFAKRNGNVDVQYYCF